ncbi:hypothetical protein BpHYR1_020576 [Brachionus plicatilis]|uniref:Uncharacterized protein n=1 Tax=Brachionus plicatilis TaxID=10195 RepID=A0A3M7QJ02_BRAPC|nr:hypothetical protein BpHYR1_020576 [Brachionus plicatilis]
MQMKKIDKKLSIDDWACLYYKLTYSALSEKMMLLFRELQHSHIFLINMSDRHCIKFKIQKNYFYFSQKSQAYCRIRLL